MPLLECRSGLADHRNCAQTRQDIADHSKFVHAQWAERYGRLRRGQGIWGQPIAADAWELDFTEGHCRIRKKLVQHDTLSRPLQHEEARDERTSRSLGASRNDAAMPEKHQRERRSVASKYPLTDIIGRSRSRIRRSRRLKPGFARRRARVVGRASEW